MALVQMNVFLNSIAAPFTNANLNSGTVKVEELTIWPGWTEHPYDNVLAEYTWKSTPNTKRQVLLDPGIVNNFHTISNKFNSEINRGAGGVVGAIAALSYANGRVNLSIKSGTQLASLKISDFVAKQLKIDHFATVHGATNVGKPVDLADIQLFNAKNLHFTCDELKDHNYTYINSEKFDTILTAAPFDPETEKITFEPSEEMRFSTDLGKLRFHLKNENGTNLRVERVFARVSINKDKQCDRKRYVHKLHPHPKTMTATTESAMVF